ncbi:hypothetical protein H0H81_001106 [Sphagnurus paluster]|uniref:Uncharacterized protein n=1 Tax=Sphagnurus paluster TaxID=117069 RepID=A0A9P7G0G5_9AGAR|nr:hypothetical protein H0H81_001106 [Sphagnurus paluster]
MPKLDLKSKKKEVNYLMDALHRDAKTAITKERSKREELLSEMIDTLTEWLSNIWSVVYEFRDCYAQAHMCLLFTADVSSTLTDIPDLSGCKCSLSNMPIDISIKKQNGKVVKSFTLRGPHTIQRALLWIWRELFVSLAAYGSAPAKKKMPEMLEDIESILGWSALEPLLYGGSSYSLSDEVGDTEVEGEGLFDDDDEDEDYVDESDEDENEGACQEDRGSRCTCPYHASHWSDHVNDQRIHLRDLVENRLYINYRVCPSLQLYNVICGISHDSCDTERTLLRETIENAAKSADTFVGALEVYNSLSAAERISQLLKTHFHLLRARDAEVLQQSIRVLMTHGYTEHSLDIIEQELLESLRSIQAAVVGVFGKINEMVHKEELEGILKLRAGTQERQDRTQEWVGAVVTAVPPMNPMAFAAMMMGFPVGDPLEDPAQGEPIGFLDEVDTSDPDYEELMAEFRPKLKERFEGWYKLMERSKEPAAPLLLGTIYAKAVELMPFMLAGDVVEQMILRVTELQGRNHVARALQSVVGFCATQRKKLSANALRQQRASEKTTASASSSFGNHSIRPFPSPLFSPTVHSPHAPTGGMEDVD